MGQVVQVNGDYNIKTASSGIITLDPGALGTVKITGNLEVTGKTVTVSSEIITIKDNIIVLNFDESGDGVSLTYSGIKVNRGTASNTSLVWDENINSWAFYSGSENSFVFGDNSKLTLLELKVNEIYPATEDTIKIGPAEIPQIFGDVTIEGNIFADNLYASLLFGDELTLGNIKIDGVNSLIQTIANDSDLSIEANGAGKVLLQSSTDVIGSLYIDGDIEITGNAIFGGNTVDTITVRSAFASNLVPENTNTHDLGTTTSTWRTVYASKFVGEIYGGTF